MVAKLNRMQPRMDKLNEQYRKYEEYQEMKRSVVWYKRFSVWKYCVEDPYYTPHDFRNQWFKINYEELASAISHMKTDESYFIDSLEFDKYGLE